jgi:hypothetical protein
MHNCTGVPFVLSERLIIRMQGQPRKKGKDKEKLKEAPAGEPGAGSEPPEAPSAPEG